MGLLGWCLTLNGVLLGIIVWMWVLGTGMVLLHCEWTGRPQHWRATLWPFAVIQAYPGPGLPARAVEPLARSTGCAFCDGGTKPFHDGTQPYHLSPGGKHRSLCRRFMSETPKR